MTEFFTLHVYGQDRTRRWVPHKTLGDAMGAREDCSDARPPIIARAFSELPRVVRGKEIAAALGIAPQSLKTKFGRRGFEWLRKEGASHRGRFVALESEVLAHQSRIFGGGE